MSGGQGQGPPVSWLVVERGWKVVDAEGAEVGRVQDVVAEAVAEITDGQVRLSLRDDEVGELDEHEPPPPSEQLRP